MMGDHNGLMGNHQGNDSYALATGTNEGYKYQPDVDSDRRFPAGVLGHHYMANPPVEIMDIPRDRATSPESKKKLKLIGSVAASLALTFALVGTACSKLNAGAVRVNKRPVPAEQSANAPTDSSDVVATEPRQEADPNMNTETADSEHDGKISYEIYEYDPYSPNTNCLVPAGEHSSQVDYAADDTVDERKEASLSDLAEFVAKRNENDPVNTKFSSINDVFAKGEDYHGHNAIADMLKKYGGYDHFKFKTSNYHVVGYDGKRIVNDVPYHCPELADVDPNIVDGLLSISVFNPDNCEDWERGYSGYYTLRISELYSNEEQARKYGYPFRGGMIVCDHMPTEKELIQIIKDNYSSLFKMTDKFSDPISTNRDTMAKIKYDKQKP